MRIQLKDGSYEWIDSHEQFVRLVEQQMGEDVGRYIEQLAGEADYTTRKLDTDLDCYESDLEEQKSAAMEMDDYIMEAINHINDSKHINKNKLIQLLNQAHGEYCNNF